MTSPVVLSLAILKANWDSLRRDYLDNFVPLAAECVRISSDDIVTAPGVQQGLRTHFGLNIPLNCIHTILRRVQKRGYIRLHNKVYSRVVEKLDTLDFHRVQQQVLEMHEKLTSSLISFCKERYGVLWSSEDAETALQAYLTDNHMVISRAVIGGAIIPPPNYEVRSAKFLVGAFVRYMQETSAAGFEYFETVVKGNLLANAIFLPDPGRASAHFRRSVFYFDTSFLIYALGYAGQARKEPCLELLELLYETGASLACFTHTLDEVKGALGACAERIAHGQLRHAYGPSMEYFISVGSRASDIELFIVQLERNLNAVRIRLIGKPDYDPEYTIGEKALQEALEASITYRTTSAVIRDVDSISAIMRLRRGRDYFLVEECLATFVTMNVQLARVSAEFFYPQGDSRAVAPCLTDFTLTNLLWLKKPLLSPTLPRKRIIADCYAATQPSDQLWRNYLVETEKLETRGDISSHDYYMLRYSLEAKTALMDLTLGAEEAFSQATVLEMLEIVRSQVQADVLEQLRQEQELRSEAEKTVESEKAKESERNLRLRERAIRYAKRIASGAEYALIVALGVSVFFTFPWDLPPIPSSLFRYLISAFQLLLLILTVANLMYGTAVVVRVRNLETVLAAWIESRLRALSGG